MATFGQGINPQLGAIDYSPILKGSVAGAEMAAKGGQMIGQGLANLGQEMGKGIEAYYKKKEIKKLEDDGVAFVQKIGARSPHLLKAVGLTDINDTGAIKAGLKASGGVVNFLNMAQVFKGELDKTQAADIAMRYGPSGGASSYMGADGETFGSPEANMMAQNQYMAQTTERLKQDKLRAEAANLRLPQKPENLTLPERAAQAEIAAWPDTHDGQAPTKTDIAKIYSDIQKRTSPSPVNPEETARYTLLTGEMKDIGTKADAALKLRPTLKSLYDKLEKGLQTGALEDWKTTFSGYAKAVGIPVDEKMLADKQSARASFGTFLMEYIAATKGSISERENTLFMSMGPQFANIPEANKELLSLVQSRQDLDIKLGNIYRDGLSKNTPLGKINEEMQTYRQEFEKKYEINIGKLEEKYVPQKPSGMEQKVWDAMPMSDRAIFKK